MNRLFLVFALLALLPLASAYHEYGFESDFYGSNHYYQQYQPHQGYDVARYHGLYNYPQVRTYQQGFHQQNYYHQNYPYQSVYQYHQDYYQPTYPQPYYQQSSYNSPSDYSVVGHPTHRGFYNFQPFQEGYVITDYYS